MAENPKRPSSQWSEPVVIETGDLEIGAVEIKDATSTNRLVVDASGLLGSLVTVSNEISSLATVTQSGNVNSLSTITQSGTFTVTQVGNVNSLGTVTQVGTATISIGEDFVPSAVVGGMVSCATGGQTQFGANAINWVSVFASSANATTCFIGNSSATYSLGYGLAPGSNSPTFKLSNTNLLYLAGGYGNLEVRFIGGN